MIECERCGKKIKENKALDVAFTNKIVTLCPNCATICTIPEVMNGE